MAFALLLLGETAFAQQSAPDSNRERDGGGVSGGVRCPELEGRGGFSRSGATRRVSGNSSPERSSPVLSPPHVILGLITRHTLAYVAVDQTISLRISPDVEMYAEMPLLLALHRIDSSWWVQPRNAVLRQGNGFSQVECQPRR